MQFWYTKNVIACLLWPISMLYLGIISLRRFIYRMGFKKATCFPVPIVIVGNITVGGTGKTPLVIWLASFFQTKGYKPGIVSRGYGGKAVTFPQQVHEDSDPREVGDEALLLALHTSCPVIVDPVRTRAVSKLLATTDCNLIISDDGLQHYALHRDIEIAVIDGMRRFGNNFCLPAGPLREPRSRLAQVNFMVCNGVGQHNEYSMGLFPGAFTQLKDPARTVTASYFQSKIVHAVSGIGNPARFYSLLRLQGLNFIEHTFPDHYLFKFSDIDFGPDSFVIMTEKDAVKCKSFADERHWYLPIRVQLPEKFSTALLQSLVSSAPS